MLTALAMFYLFLAVYSMGVDVAGVVFYSELFPNHIRAKGVCLSMATVALADLVYLQATTTAFANIGWRFYLVSVAFCFPKPFTHAQIGLHCYHFPR